MTKIAMHTRPTMAGPLRRSRRRASPQRPRLARAATGRLATAVPAAISAVPDARVEEGVADVHDEVHHEEDEGEDQDRRLDHEVVMVLDGVDPPGAHPVPGEDRLGDHRPGQEAAYLEPDDGGHRQPGVAHDVAGIHPPLGETLGPG